MVTVEQKGYVGKRREIILQSKAGSTGKALKGKMNSSDYAICSENLTFYSASMEIERGGQERRLEKEFGAH